VPIHAVGRLQDVCPLLALDAHPEEWERIRRMKCPHCLESFHRDEGAAPPGQTLLWKREILKDCDGAQWVIRHTLCPACNRVIIWVDRIDLLGGGRIIATSQVVPKGTARSSLSPVIPSHFADDYREASNVLADSPKASAALSRRCLQRLLREKAGVKHGDLYDEIQEVLEAKSLPTYLAEQLHNVREIGKFAAHPIKSKSSGEIVDVEPGEAEWSLDTLESLFDFYFVAPEKLKARRDALSQKLSDAESRKGKGDSSGQTPSGEQKKTPG